jgi:hypothetical protein
MKSMMNKGLNMTRKVTFKIVGIDLVSLFLLHSVVQGKLGMTYVYDCEKGFNHGVNNLKFLAAELMKAYADAQPDEVAPSDFQC